MRAATDEPRPVSVPWRVEEPEPLASQGITYMIVGAYASLILFVIW